MTPRWLTVGLIGAALGWSAGCAPKRAPDTLPPPSGGDVASDAPSPEESAAAAKPGDARRKVADAVAQLTIGTPDAARRAAALLEEAARRDPKNPWIYYNLGVAREQLGELAPAEAAFREAVSLDPKMGSAWMGLGLVAEKRGDSSGAIRQYRDGVAQDPEDMELRSALVGALRRAGRGEEAIAEAKSALAFNNKSLAIFNDLGLVYLERGELPMAQFVFQKALDQVDGARNSALIRSNYGWALYLDGKRIQARGQLEQAYRIDGTYLPALVYLAHFYLDDRNYADAVPLLEAARKQEPDNAGILLNLGIAYRGIGRLEDARRTYERALEVGRGSPEPLLNLGVLYADYLKDYPKALDAFGRYISQRGVESALAQTYIDGVQKEQLRLERQRERDEERKKREQERLERERLLREGEGGKPPAPPPDGGGAPWGPQ
jgi:tetratricopeptide (TPR) repeat protein